MKLSHLFKLCLISSPILLSACGGSSGGNDDKENVLPALTTQSITVNENTEVTVTATASDSDGTIISYNWQQTSGSQVTLTGENTSSLSFTTPSVLNTGEVLTFSISVTDNNGGTAESVSTVTINNVAPIVTVDNKTVDEKSNVTVAANITDSGDSIASYSWIQTSGTTVDLAGSNTANLTFTAPEVKADEVIGLSLTVTDTDNDSVSIESLINVSQLTIPLTISGMATDSPIQNGEISVNVAGRDITVDVTADENGLYSVDLLLDDTEASAFISITAYGVASQLNAGLITLLGTAGELSEKAGGDNILTEDESFAVNVTNITTAQYALANLANGGQSITNDTELALLTQSLNYNEVLTLATAIKVAIDKASDNPDLALPSGTTNTLALVDNPQATQVYVQQVINKPEFLDAQQEMFADENLVDTSSDWSIPESYYVLPPGSLSSGFIFRFNQDGTGERDKYRYTWQQVEGEVTANIIKDDTSYFTEGYVYRYVNDEYLEILVHYSVKSYSLKRLSSNNNSDVLLLKTVNLTHFPNGEFDDETEAVTTTHSAIKPAGIIEIAHTGAGIAYLPFNDEQPDDPSIRLLGADEFTLNTDGSGHATVLNLDFSWKIENGSLKLAFPADSGNSYIPTWQKLTTDLALNQFAHEFIENGEIRTSDDHIGEGAILTAPLAWQESAVAGIYTYDNATFADPLENFWFELHENGDAETYSSSDVNSDGVVTEDELSIQYGNWKINTDGTLVLSRVRHQGGGYTEECREASTEGCILYHERTWRLIAQDENAYGLFHKHDFKFTNFDWNFENDEITYDNRTLFKVENPPVPHTADSTKINKSELYSKPQNQPNKHKVKMNNRLSKLEPDFN